MSRISSSATAGRKFCTPSPSRAWAPAGRLLLDRFRGQLHFIPAWVTAIILLGGVATAIVLGLRALSADYLIRVSAMVHGGSHVKTKVRRSLLGEVVQRFFGGQAGRAGFDYMRRMMQRDWQFRRQLLSIIPLIFFIVAGFGNVVFSKNPSPFAAGFSAVHALPRVIGTMLLVICRFLEYGTDYKGIWLFLTVPDRSLLRFAQGVHASLWLTFIVIPHTLLLGLFVWRWGIADAALFVAYSAAAVSIYLAVALRFVNGVPFGKQLNPSRTATMQFGMILTFVLVMIAVGIQYLIFRSHIVVEFLVRVLWVATYLITRSCLGSFEISIRHNLALESGASKLVYSEVEAF